MSFITTNKLKRFSHSLKKSKFFRFLLVGVLNTIFGFSIFALFVQLGLDDKSAVLFSMILGVLFNFKSTGTLVFANENNKLLLRFICVYVIIFFLNIGGLSILKSIPLGLDLDPKTKTTIAGGILVLPLAIVSFVLNKLFVFREPVK
jgi:putative flippase GtrA